MEEAFAAIRRAALPKQRLLVPTLNDAAGAKHGDLVADPVERSDFFFTRNDRISILTSVKFAIEFRGR
jgi:hypothetical protein